MVVFALFLGGFFSLPYLIKTNKEVNKTYSSCAIETDAKEADYIVDTFERACIGEMTIMRPGMDDKSMKQFCQYRAGNMYFFIIGENFNRRKCFEEGSKK